MKINKDNCEAWFLDYYEGNLSTDKVEELFLFLRNHPEMREVFESFGDVTLDDETTAVPDFSFLKRTSEITKTEEAEKWMVDEVEGVISAEDKAKLDQYLIRFPEKRKELELLRRTKLTPDNITFDFSETLKKDVPVTADNFDDYAIAALEGTLSEKDKQKWDEFLMNNPEFRTDWELYSVSKLTPENITYPEKDSLKRTPVSITPENIDEYIIRDMEGDLGAGEKTALENFFEAWPEFRKQRELYAKTVLAADTDTVYPDKSSLKRTAVSVNESNFEELACAMADDSLNNEEAAAVVAFAGNDPSRLRTIELYRRTRLTAETVAYPNKGELKRRKGGAIFWNMRMNYAAAVAVLLVLGVSIWIKTDTGVADPVSPNLASHQNNPVTPQTKQNVPVAVPLKDDVQKDVIPAVNSTPSRYVASVDKKETREEFVVIPSRNAPEQVYSSAEEASVQFSGEYYNSISSVAQNTAPEFPSATQLMMRWVKSKLDGSSPRTIMSDNNTMQAFNGKNDNEVSGLDITESAVNRIGDMAANGKVNMNHQADGTYLNLWNYSVRVSGE